MRTTVRLLAHVGLVVAGSCLLRQPLHAQWAESWKASSIHAVMTYRVTALGDTTAKFDRCRVDRQLTGGETRQSRLEDLDRLMLGPCDTREEVADRATVLVDSIKGDQSGASVYLTVRRGGYVHNEVYELVPIRRAAEMMFVNGVRLSPAQEYYRPHGTTGGVPPA